MKAKETEDKFVQEFKKALDQSARDLDAGTLARLTRARQAALAKQKATVVPWWQWMKYPAAGLATALLIFTFVNITRPPQDYSGPVATLEDMDIIAAADHLELYADLDFYSWLAEKQADAG